jgi:hypothetical protein
MRLGHHALLAAALLAVVALARNGVAADSFADLTLEDQHGQAQTVAPDTRTIVFAGDMDASKIVHALLGERESDYLPRHRAVFIADIHRMPGFITRFIALPRMRRYPYRMLLIRDDETGQRFARQEGAVTVVTLAGLQAATTSHVTSRDALERAIVGEGP